MQKPKPDYRIVPLEHSPGGPSDLDRFLGVLAESRKRVLFCALAGVVLALALSFLVPMSFQSRAAILPVTDPQKDGPAGSELLEKIAPELASTAQDETKAILAFLESSSLRLDLIRGLDLIPRLYSPWWKRAGLWLASLVDADAAPTPVTALQDKEMDRVFKVRLDKRTGTVELFFQDPDPEVAARALGLALDLLRGHLDQEYLVRTRRERVLLEERLSQAASRGQGLASRRPTPDYPAGRIEAELAANQAVQAELMAMLSLARMDEARRLTAFRVVDPPLVPEKKFRPKRGVMAVMGFLCAGLAALVAAFWRAYRLESEGRTGGR